MEGCKFEANGLSYQVNDDGATVSVAETKVEGEVVIPSEVSNNGKTYPVVSIGKKAFYDCDKLANVTIPNSVKSIGECAFYDCDSLTCIEIPNSVTNIGDNAFFGCSGLTSVAIPASVTRIGGSAFDFCERLANVEIPNTVTSIGDRTFWSCKSLTSVTIPNSVTSIGERAFRECWKLASVAIPNSVTSIGMHAFFECKSLKSVTIPHSVENIGFLAFYGCSDLTSINVESDNPNYVSIDGILYNKDVTELICCPAGKAGGVTIPNSVTSIGEFAFSGCLTSVICKAEVPPRCSSDSFSLDDATLYVPKGTVEAYKNAAGWNEFLNIEEIPDIQHKS